MGSARSGLCLREAAILMSFLLFYLFHFYSAYLILAAQLQLLSPGGGGSEAFEQSSRHGAERCRRTQTGPCVMSPALPRRPHASVRVHARGSPRSCIAAHEAHTVSNKPTWNSGIYGVHILECGIHNDHRRLCVPH